MIKCSKCGEELNDGAKFCMECGAPVLQEKECLQCGAKLPLNAKFCFECGSSQEIDDSVEEDASTDCTVVAKDKEHLKKLIDEAIAKEGLECDLNFIDVSHVKDMSSLFSWGQDHQRYNFNGDISLWDVSNVKNMNSMFRNCTFSDCEMICESLNQWKVPDSASKSGMFIGSTLEEEGLYPTWYTDESASKSEKNSDWFDAGDLSVFETSSPHIVDVEESNFGEQNAEEIDLSEDDEE